MEREDVYKLIDGERNYQKAKFGDELASIGDYIVWMQQYLNLAASDATFSEPPNALEAIRKVTALGVACMEQHDTPAR